MAAPPKVSPVRTSSERVAKYADMFSAMGTEPRLRIMQLLLTAHPEGLVVSEIQEELDIPNSTLSHHLDKLRTEGLVEVRRRKHVSSLHRQYRCIARVAAIPLCRMLHAQSSAETSRHCSNL